MEGVTVNVPFLLNVLRLEEHQTESTKVLNVYQFGSRVYEIPATLLLHILSIIILCYFGWPVFIYDLIFRIASN